MNRERLAEKRKEAEERKAARAKRTDQQQIAKLVKAGHGHCKEVGILKKRIKDAKKEKKK